MTQETADMATLPKPRFDPSYSYGQILQTLTVLASVAVALYAFGKRDAKYDADLVANQQAIQTLAAAYDKLDLIVRPLVQANALTNQRVDMLSAQSLELRQISRSIMEHMAAIREDVAGVKAQMTARTPR